MGDNKIKFMTIRELAKTGILSEYCLRNMLKRGQLPVVYSGKKALVNVTQFCHQLSNISTNL